MFHCLVGTMVFRTTLLLVLFTVGWPTRLDAYYRKPKGFDTNIVPDDLWAPTEGLVDRLGYVVETHRVRSPDGYILTMHRVPRAKNSSEGTTLHRTPVLCNGGLATTSEMWVIREGNNIVTHLVDAGFDVWLTNFRGNHYSRRHATLKTKSHKFWDFSWNENGLFDMPTFIDYVLRITGRSKLMTVGHSMGTTSMAVLMSEMPEYAKEKVLCNVFLAPPMYFSKPSGYLQAIRGLFSIIPQLKDATGRFVVNDAMPLADQSTISLCFFASNTQMTSLCRTMINLVVGKPHSNLTSATALRLLSHFPGGASIRQFLHYGQNLASGGVAFQKYDFGPEKNQKLYGSLYPPKYNLSAIQTPIYVFYGTSDALVSSEDALKFVNNCPAVKEVFKLPYNHFEYVLGDTVNDDVSIPVVKILRKYI